MPLPRLPVPTDDEKSSRITLRMRPPVKRAVAVLAAERGTTVMALIEEILLRDPDVVAHVARFSR